MLSNPDLVWAHTRELSEYAEMLNGSRNYRTLYDRAFREHDLNERRHNIHSRPDYAVIVKVLQRNYVADVDDVLQDAAHALRLMNTCFYNHYTVFLLRRNSRHTAYLNRWIRRYRESGILQLWSRQMTRRQDESVMRSFFDRDVRLTRHVRTVSWNLTNFSGAIVVLTTGYAMGVVVFAIEWVVGGRRRYRTCSVAGADA